jgi:hypothetical protein
MRTGEKEAKRSGGGKKRDGGRWKMRAHRVARGRCGRGKSHGGVVLVNKVLKTQVEGPASTRKLLRRSSNMVAERMGTHLPCDAVVEAVSRRRPHAQQQEQEQ